jgi:hypothetical protein
MDKASILPEISAVVLAYFTFGFLLNLILYHFEKTLLIRLSITTALSLIGGLLLLGLPGVLALGLAKPFINLIWGVKDLGDTLWPKGVITTLVWPAFIIPCYFVSFEKFETGTFLRILLFTAMIIASGILCALVVFAWGQSTVK